MPYYFVRVVLGGEPAPIGPYETEREAYDAVADLDLDDGELDECIFVTVNGTVSFTNAADWFASQQN